MTNLVYLQGIDEKSVKGINYEIEGKKSYSF